MRNILLLLLLSCISILLPAQFKLYEDSFTGGVVTGGYSNGATVPSGTGNFNVVIPAGSTIRRAYLMAGRVGAAPDVTVTLNGTPYTFNASNIVTTGFTTIYGGTSAVHAIDITAGISAATSAYSLAVPVQNTVSDKYPEFYLYIAFNNSSLPTVNTAIFCNVLTASSSMAWTLTTTNPVTNTNPVGLGILGGYAAAGSDCENVNVNGTAIGNFSGTDFNASSMWGAMSGFQYYNSVLTGYNDDNSNQPMSGPDALSNIQAIIPASTSSIPVTFTHCGGGSDNHVWAVFLTWTGAVILDQGLGPVKAERSEQGVLVSWQYAGSVQGDVFHIEKSRDLSYFESVGSVASEQKTAFTFRDESGAAGQVWYRVKCVGLDGSVRVSEAVRVNGEGSQSIIAGLSPNPVTAGESVRISISCGEEVTYKLYNSAGGTAVQSGLLQGSEAELQTSGLAAGVYFLEVKGCAGTQRVKLAVR